MNFIFSEEQIQFKDAIKSFLAEECTPLQSEMVGKQISLLTLDRWKNLIELGS